MVFYLILAEVAGVPIGNPFGPAVLAPLAYI